MQVHRDEWHVRVYLWWYNHKYDKRSWEAPKTHTNLCPYMRAVMFWAPFRAFFWNWITLFKVGDVDVSSNFFTIPFLMYALPQPLGYLSYKLKIVLWYITLLSTATAITGVTLLAAAVLIWRGIKAWNRNHPAKPTLVDADREYELYLKRVQRRRRKELRRQKWARFGSLVEAFLRSNHDRVCPEIQIVNAPLPPPPPDPGSSTTIYEV